jgi:hypothetical protein
MMGAKTRTRGWADSEMIGEAMIIVETVVESDEMA